MVRARTCNREAAGSSLVRLFTHNVPLFTKQYKLVPAIRRRGSVAVKVTVGLASHWPCVTDSVVYPPTGSMAWEKAMSTLPKLHSEYYGIFTFIPYTRFEFKHSRSFAFELC